MKCRVWHKHWETIIEADRVRRTGIGGDSTFTTLQFFKNDELIAEVDDFHGWSVDSSIREIIRK